MSHHFDCPDCGHALRIRTSHPLGKTVRGLQYECMNPECGASFVARVSIETRLSLPAQPTAEVQIPLSKHINRARLRAVLADAPDGDYQPKTMSLPNGELFDG